MELRQIMRLIMINVFVQKIFIRTARKNQK